VYYYDIEKYSVRLFEGRKLTLIKYLRQATNCGLWVAKHVADMCGAINHKTIGLDQSDVGSFGDVTICINFIIFLHNKGVNTVAPSDNDKKAIREALSILEGNSTIPVFVGEMVAFWEDSYEQHSSIEGSR